MLVKKNLCSDFIQKLKWLLTLAERGQDYEILLAKLHFFFLEVDGRFDVFSVGLSKL